MSPSVLSLFDMHRKWQSHSVCMDALSSDKPLWNQQSPHNQVQAGENNESWRHRYVHDANTRSMSPCDVFTLSWAT
jgi:hypothetical protein